MEFKVNLKHVPIVRLCEEPIAINESTKIFIKFNSDVYEDLNLMIFVRNNGNTTVYSAKKNTLINLSGKLKAGTTEIIIKNVIKGETVKTWEIVPIIIKEVTPDFMLLDMLSNLEKRLADLEEKHKSIL